MTVDAQHRIRVFLSYSRHDKDEVGDICRLLSLDGFLPWFDKESLVAGQEWALEVSEAIAQADAVVVFLSERAVSSAGYLHKEISLGLELAQRQPEGSILVIPLRLDAHPVPQKLRHLHWIDFAYPKWGPVPTKILLPTPFLPMTAKICCALADLECFSIGSGYLRLQRALLAREIQLASGRPQTGVSYQSYSYVPLAEKGVLDYLVCGRCVDGRRYYGTATIRLTGHTVSDGYEIEMRTTIETDVYAYTGILQGPALELTGAHQVGYCATLNSGLLVGI